MKAKRIGIIGAGPAGLAALKTALEAPEYHSGEWADPVVLEAREDVGGVWLPAPASFPEPKSSHAIPTPFSSSPKSNSQSQCQTHYPPTPLYDSLTTNLPHPVMAFSSFPFPPSTPLFPKASIVQSYLEAYADQAVNRHDPRRLREFVKTRRRVTSVRWAPDAGLDSNVGGDKGAWEIEAQVEEAGERAQMERYAFDLLLVCTGHYSMPNYPSEGDMPGLGAWRETGRAAHAVWYRNAESIPLPVGEDNDAFQQHDKRSHSTMEGEKPNDAYPRIVPPKQGTDRSQEGSDICLEVLEKAVADAQISEHIPHSHSIPHPDSRHAESTLQSINTTTGAGNGVSNPGHIHERESGRLGRATLLIIGTGPSGTDISADLVRAGVCRVIIASSATPSTPSNSSPSTTTPTTACASTVIAKPLPVRFHVHATKPTGRVTFADGSVEDSVTFVVLATGYQVEFPFFDQRLSSETSNSMGRFRLPKGVLPTPFWTENGEGCTAGLENKSLTNSNICVFPLAQHLFPIPGFYADSSIDQKSSGGSSIPHPTSLAFLGLNVRVAPLPLVEAQARAVLSAFAYCYSPQIPQTSRAQDEDGRAKTKDLDWVAEERAIRERWGMLEAQYEESTKRSRDIQGQPGGDSEDLLKRTFIAKIWHRLPEDKQFAYRDDLDRFAFGLDPSLNSRRPSSKDDAGPHKTREWELRMYMQKDVLRSAWRALEARGDGSAAEWVRDVGSGKTGRRKRGPGGDAGEVMNGEEEWVDMMERLIVWWETVGKREDEERIAVAAYKL
ncbi:hypothetical protein D9619_007830 [Psilocybe cf. subviscida]|uniref:FAD/NAD(P)-binding domain-containing protein n=1 Tax=Psilocybe cf. subviscida TaxID=2480587 RepID=A0A8H5ATV7_9AGAR|nr:hypothetical protein D9619_007830 [Psilocybe cf. subviscida]